METDHDGERGIEPGRHVAEIAADVAAFPGAWLGLALGVGLLIWLYSGSPTMAAAGAVLVLAACMAAFGWRVEGLILSTAGALAAMAVAAAFIPAQWQLPLFAAAVAGAGVVGWGLTAACLPNWRWIPAAVFGAAAAHVLVLPWWAMVVIAGLAGVATWKLNMLSGAVLSSIAAGGLASAGVRLVGVDAIGSWYVWSAVAGGGFGVQWYALRPDNVDQRLWWLEAGCLAGGAAAHVAWAVLTAMQSWTGIFQSAAGWREGVSDGLIAGALLLGVILAGSVRFVFAMRPDPEPYPYLFAVSLVLAASAVIHGVVPAGAAVIALLLAGVAVDAFGLVVEPGRPAGELDEDEVDDGSEVEYGG